MMGTTCESKFVPCSERGIDLCQLKTILLQFLGVNPFHIFYNLVHVLWHFYVGLPIFVTSHGKTYTNGYPLKRAKRTAEK